MLQRLNIVLIPATYALASYVLFERTHILSSAWTWLLIVLTLALALIYCLSPFFKSQDNAFAAALVDKHCGTKSRLTNAYFLSKKSTSSVQNNDFTSLVLEDASKHYQEIDIKRALPYSPFRHQKMIVGGLLALTFACIVSRPPKTAPTLTVVPSRINQSKKTSLKSISPMDKESQDTINLLLQELNQTLVGNEGNPEKSKKWIALQKLIEDFKTGRIDSITFWSEFKTFEKRLSTEHLKTSRAAFKALGSYTKVLKRHRATSDLAKALNNKDWESADKQLDDIAAEITNGQKNKNELASVFEKAAKQLSESLSKNETKILDKKTQLKNDFEKAKKAIENKGQKNQKENMAKLQHAFNKNNAELKKEHERLKNNSTHLELKKLASRTKELSTQLRNNTPQNRTQRQSSMRQLSKSFKRLSGDSRRIAKAPKAKSQLSDLKEALRRAKRQTKNGAQSKLGRNAKKKIFNSRANGESPKSESDSGQGSQSSKKGGSLSSSGGSEYGEGHAPQFQGQSTPKIGKTKDSSIQGIQTKGRSVRETIITSAQSGFSQRDYKDVYVKYKNITEKAIAKENVPSGYRYLVKRYFKSIEPRTP